MTADTFKQAQHQYEMGYMNANSLRQDVTGALEIRILRVISDLFLWLAQVQTLIRLFPRHREKMLIKWFGFLLICLDITFSCLNSFIVNTGWRPRSYQDAIPALSYLFQLALNLLYAAWVFYYALTKRRYAFYHPMMPCICIIAFISMISLLIPAAFFLVDILEPNIGAWGDYFRWVGAAAASIVVWEWVERIEAVEAEEKKDGILGREIYDGDDDYSFAPSDATSWSGRSRSNMRSSRSQGSQRPPRTYVDRMMAWSRHLFQGPPLERDVGPKEKASREGVRPKVSATSQGRELRYRKDAPRVRDSTIQSPPPIASPVDRANANSVGSTVYTVHYHPVTNTPPLQGAPFRGPSDTTNETSQVGISGQSIGGVAPAEGNATIRGADAEEGSRGEATHRTWRFALNTLRRGPKSPPAEIKNAESSPTKPQNWDSKSQRARFSLIGRLTAAAPNPRDKRQPHHQEPTVIPAPPRGQTWSPDQYRHSPLDPGWTVWQRSEQQGLQVQRHQGHPRLSPVSPAVALELAEEAPAVGGTEDSHGRPDQIPSPSP